MTRFRALLAGAVLLLAATITDGTALARGGHGGAHFSGSRVAIGQSSAGHIGGLQRGGARFGSSRFSGSRFGGSHFGGSRFRGSHFHGGHFRSRVGVFVGIPLFFPSWYYYPPPAAYYDPVPPPVYYYEDPNAYASTPAPQMYSQPGAESAAPAPATAYWYYCSDSKGYYPDVNECPGGWQKVAPRAAPSEPSAPPAN